MATGARHLSIHPHLRASLRTSSLHPKPQLDEPVQALPLIPKTPDPNPEPLKPNFNILLGPKILDQTAEALDYILHPAIQAQLALVGDLT